jgi:hypothetical protein
MACWWVRPCSCKAATIVYTNAAGRVSTVGTTGCEACTAGTSAALDTDQEPSQPELPIRDGGHFLFFALD